MPVLCLPVSGRTLRRFGVAALAGLLLGAGRPSAADLARAIDLYYTRGPAAALSVLEGLPQPVSDDAAWWVARCWLDLGVPEQALAAVGDHGIGGPPDQRHPQWIYPALRAEGLVLRGDRAGARREAGLVPRGGNPSLQADPRWRRAGWVAALLALEAGDEGDAARWLRVLGDREPWADVSPALRDRLAPLADVLAPVVDPAFASTGVLWFARGGRDWSWQVGSPLARAGTRPAPSIRVGPGSDLWRSEGLLFDVPAIRFDPSVDGGDLLWGAEREPLCPCGPEAGLFVRTLPAGPVRRLVSTPPGALDLLPVRDGGGATWFVRRQGGRGSLMRGTSEGVTRCSPELAQVAGVTVLGGVVVISALLEARPALLWRRTDAPPEEASRPLFGPAWEAWAPAFEARGPEEGP